MCCAIKFCYHWNKAAPAPNKSMKEAYKDKIFGESTIFRWYDDFKKGFLVAEPAPQLGRPESVVNNRNVGAIL